MTFTLFAVLLRRPTGHIKEILVTLPLIFIQMLTSLGLYAGVFIRTEEISISPFQFCKTRQHGEPPCVAWNRSLISKDICETKRNIFSSVTIVALYASVVLVAFALLAMWLAVYAKDTATLWVSMVCQAVSCLLILTGIATFLLLNQSYVSWDHMTFSFYVCVSVLIQLVIVTALTYVSVRQLPFDQKQTDTKEKSLLPC
ncbi:uncharacterized protein V6R79_003457 [Siganus canaliculatus]